MRTNFTITLAFLGLTSAAFAASPHFSSATAAFAGSSADLTVTFKEAGLGDTVKVDYVASASAASTWGCITGGGKNPSAANKRTISTPVSQPGTFSSAKNGSVSGSITLKAPPAPAPTDFSCPSGQKLELVSVSWTGVSLQDKTNGVAAPIAGTFTKTLLTLK